MSSTVTPSSSCPGNSAPSIPIGFDRVEGIDQKADMRHTPLGLGSRWRRVAYAQVAHVIGRDTPHLLPKFTGSGSGNPLKQRGRAASGIRSSCCLSNQSTPNDSPPVVPPIMAGTGVTPQKTRVTSTSSIPFGGVEGTGGKVDYSVLGNEGAYEVCSEDTPPPCGGSTATPSPFQAPPPVGLANGTVIGNKMSPVRHVRLANRSKNVDDCTGLTCWQNATMQLLRNAQIGTELEIWFGTVTKEEMPSKYEWLYNVASQLVEINNAELTDDIVNIRSTGIHGACFDGTYGQEDAVDFLNKIMQGVVEMSKSHSDLMTEGLMEWTKNQRVKLTHRHKCSHCKKMWTKIEAFNIFDLQKTANRLEGCFEVWKREQTVTDFQCPHCKTTGKVATRSSVAPPSEMFVNLVGSRETQFSDYIEFDSVVYEATGTVCRRGATSKSGHWWAQIKSEDNSYWEKLDDFERARKVDPYEERNQVVILFKATAKSHGFYSQWRAERTYKRDKARRDLQKQRKKRLQQQRTAANAAKKAWKKSRAAKKRAKQRQSKARKLALVKEAYSVEPTPEPSKARKPREKKKKKYRSSLQWDLPSLTDNKRKRDQVEFSPKDYGFEKQIRKKRRRRQKKDTSNGSAVWAAKELSMNPENFPVIAAMTHDETDEVEERWCSDPKCKKLFVVTKGSTTRHKCFDCLDFEQDPVANEETLENAFYHALDGPLHSLEFSEDGKSCRTAYGDIRDITYTPFNSKLGLSRHCGVGILRGILNNGGHHKSISMRLLGDGSIRSHFCPVKGRGQEWSATKRKEPVERLRAEDRDESIPDIYKFRKFTLEDSAICGITFFEDTAKQSKGLGDKQKRLSLTITNREFTGDQTVLRGMYTYSDCSAPGCATVTLNKDCNELELCIGTRKITGTLVDETNKDMRQRRRRYEASQKKQIRNSVKCFMYRRYESPDWGTLEFTNDSEILTKYGFQVTLVKWNPKSRQLEVRVRTASEPDFMAEKMTLSFHDDGSMTYWARGEHRRCLRATTKKITTDRKHGTHPWKYRRFSSKELGKPIRFYRNHGTGPQDLHFTVTSEDLEKQELTVEWSQTGSLEKGVLTIHYTTVDGKTELRATGKILGYENWTAKSTGETRKVRNLFHMSDSEWAQLTEYHERIGRGENVAPLHEQPQVCKLMEMYEKEMDELVSSMQRCSICNVRWFNQTNGKKVCEKCAQYENDPSRCPWGPHTWPRMPPQDREIPACYQRKHGDPIPQIDCLSTMEAMMIALSFPNMRVNYAQGGGQRFFKGHVFNVQQDVRDFSNEVFKLPHRAEIMPYIIVERQRGSNMPAAEHKVDPKKIRAALHFVFSCHSEYIPLVKNGSVTLDEEYLNNLEQKCQQTNSKRTEPSDIRRVVTQDLEKEKEELQQAKREELEIGDHAYLFRTQTSVVIERKREHKDGTITYSASSIEDGTGHIRIEPKDLVRYYGSAQAGVNMAPRDCRTEEERIEDNLQGCPRTAWPKSEGVVNMQDSKQSFRIGAKSFPCAFPYGHGCPYDSNFRGQEAERIKQLMKMATVHPDGSCTYHIVKDQRLLFWIYNERMKKQLSRQAGLFIEKNPTEAEWSIARWQKELANPEKAKSMLNRISLKTNTVKGTNSYWNRTRREVEAMISAKGCPTLFYTLSAADTRWKRLHNVIGHRPGKQNNGGQRMALLKQHPHIAAEFFHKKLKTYNKYFNAAVGAKYDFFRYEFQSRGSIHAHGFKWLKNDPGLVNLSQIAAKGNALEKQWKDKEKPVEVAEAIEAGKHAEYVVSRYCDWLVSTSSPQEYEDNGKDYKCKPVDKGWESRKHPSELNWSDLAAEDCDKDYEIAMHWLARHNCLKGSCMKNGKCRFKFPQKVTKQTHIKYGKERDDGTFQVRLVPKRNHCVANSHNRITMQHWRANTDMQIVLDPVQCLNYLTKYSCKGETRSKIFDRALKKVRTNFKFWGKERKGTSAIRSLMFQVHGQRDISIQECCHVLLGNPLHHSNLKVVNLDLGDGRRIKGGIQGDTYDTKAKELKRQRKRKNRIVKRNLFDAYASRLEEMVKFQGQDTLLCDIWPTLRTMSLSQFAISYELKNDNIQYAPRRTRGNDRVVRYWPRGTRTQGSERFAFECRQNLTVYKPWTETPNYLWKNDFEKHAEECWFSFLQSPESKTLMPQSTHMAFLNAFNKQEDEVIDELNYDGAEEPTFEDAPEWAEIAETGNIPDEVLDNHEIELESTYDAGTALSRVFQELSPTEKHELSLKVDHSRDEDEANGTLAKTQRARFDISTATESQKAVLELAAREWRLGNNIRIAIYGVAGTGKSWLIDALDQLYHDILRERGEL